MFNSLTLNHPDDSDEFDACNSLPSFRQEPSDDGTSKMREGDFPGREREKIDRTHARLAVTRRARVFPKRNSTQRNATQSALHTFALEFVRGRSRQNREIRFRDERARSRETRQIFFSEFDANPETSSSPVVCDGININAHTDLETLNGSSSSLLPSSQQTR